MNTLRLKNTEYPIADIPQNWTPSEYEHQLVSLLGGLKKQMCGLIADTQALELNDLKEENYVQANSGLYVPQSMFGFGVFDGSMSAEVIAECFRHRAEIPNAGYAGRSGFQNTEVNMEHAELLASIFNKFAADYGYADQINSFVCACFIALCACESGGIELATAVNANGGGPFAVIEAKNKTTGQSNWTKFDEFCANSADWKHLNHTGLMSGSLDLETGYVAGVWYFFVYTKQIENALAGDALGVTHKHIGQTVPIEQGKMYDKDQYFYGYVYGVAPGEFGYDKYHPNYLGHVEVFNRAISGIMSQQGSIYKGPTVAPHLLQPVNPEWNVKGSKQWVCGGNNYSWTIGDPPKEMIEPAIARSVPVITRDGNNNKRTLYINVHKALVPKFQAIFKEIYQNTAFQITDLGEHGFSYRVVEGKTTLSNHSFGTAIDVNASVNPYPKIGRQNLSSPSAIAGDGIRQIRSIHHPVVQIFAKYGFVWGARYNRGPDYMHFEWYGPK